MMNVDERNKISLTGNIRRRYLRLPGKTRHSTQTISLGGFMALDKIDRKILALLQKDATTPVAEIGRKVGLSTTPCWRRIQKMEEGGVIKGRVAVLDPTKINAGVTVFVSIRTNEHNDAWMRKFSGVVEDFTEVVEFYRMSGETDYLLRVVVPDIAAYDAFYKRLIAKIEIPDVSPVFAMEQIKYTTEMPLDCMILEKESGSSAHAA